MSTYPEFHPDTNAFLNKTTIIYGASGSGKSYIIAEIMSYLRDSIPACIVFCPTDAQNKSYGDRLVPAQLVHDKLTEEKIERILERQEKLVAGIALSNDEKLLESLYRRLIRRGDPIHRQSIERIESLRRMHKTYVENEQEKLAKEAKALLDATTKNLLFRSKDILDGEDLSDHERCALEYMRTNPNLLIVFDDCTEQIKKIEKKSAFSKLFFQGRHIHITVLMACHADTFLSPPIKQNAYLNIFTTPLAAKTYFNRATITPLTKRELAALESNIDKTIIENQKLVHRRDDNKFFKFTAREHPESFRFCDDLVWSYCDLIKASGLGYSLSDLLS